MHTQSTMITRTCRQCGAEFPIRASRIAHGRGIFCSRACFNASDWQTNRRTDAEARFWSKVQKSDGCWLWMPTSTFPYGYGAFYLNGTNVAAHRYAWELVNGPIPAGLVVCHNCPGGDNPRCCRPDHMFLGTLGDNTRDAVRKGRMTQGEASNLAKLKPEQVLDIRARAVAGGGGDGGERVRRARRPAGTRPPDRSRPHARRGRVRRRAVPRRGVRGVVRGAPGVPAGGGEQARWGARVRPNS